MRAKEEVPDQVERKRRREEYAARAETDARFRRRYHRQLMRERKNDPSRHVLLVGSPPYKSLADAIGGRPELGPRWTRKLPDGRVHHATYVLDYNP